MSDFLSDQEQTVRELFSQYADARIVPRRKKLDEQEEFPADLFEEMGRQDFFRILVPEEYGGLGRSSLQLALAVEQLSRGDGGIGISFAVNAITANGLILFGSEEQKKKYLPLIADGKLLTAFAMSEPGAGSDAAAIKTRAEKRGDRYLLNGVKQFTTNGGVAGLNTVVAVTDPKAGNGGMSVFLVDKDSPGLSFGKKEDKMGIRCSVTRELIFEDCQIPEGNVLGQPGRGLYIALGLLDRSRIGVGAQAVGIAQAALDECLSYSGTREQFGRPIGSFQAVQFMLADMATRIEAARRLLYHAARSADADAGDLTRLAAMAKLFASDVAMQVTTDAVQIFGGYGYMKDYPVEKMMRDAKVTQIYEGTNQIQRIVISSHLSKGKESK